MPQNRTDKYLPYVFTEQGVAMLSGVLKSSKAINLNIAIMRAFVEVRKVLLKQIGLDAQLQEIKQLLGEHAKHTTLLHSSPLTITSSQLTRITRSLSKVKIISSPGCGNN
jgi:hypothetical protein